MVSFHAILLVSLSLLAMHLPSAHARSDCPGKTFTDRCSSYDRNDCERYYEVEDEKAFSCHWRESRELENGDWTESECVRSRNAGCGEDEVEDTSDAPVVNVMKADTVTLTSPLSCTGFARSSCSDITDVTKCTGYYQKGSPNTNCAVSADGTRCESSGSDCKDIACNQNLGGSCPGCKDEGCCQGYFVNDNGGNKNCIWTGTECKMDSDLCGSMLSTPLKPPRRLSTLCHASSGTDCSGCTDQECCNKYYVLGAGNKFNCVWTNQACSADTVACI